MILELSGFVFSLTILLLPVIDFSLEIVIAILHLINDLLILADFNLIVFVVVDFAVKF